MGNECITKINEARSGGPDEKQQEEKRAKQIKAPQHPNHEPCHPVTVDDVRPTPCWVCFTGSVAASSGSRAVCFLSCPFLGAEDSCVQAEHAAPGLSPPSSLEGSVANGREHRLAGRAMWLPWSQAVRW